MKVVFIREDHRKSDSRVPLTPEQCRYLLNLDPDLQILVQPSSQRCFRDWEYQSQSIPIRENLSECEILLGVKEVAIS